jgi:hypothetical protein
MNRRSRKCGSLIWKNHGAFGGDGLQQTVLSLAEDVAQQRATRYGGMLARRFSRRSSLLKNCRDG